MENVVIEINPLVSALMIGLVGLLFAVIQNAINRRAQLTIDHKLQLISSKIALSQDQKKLLYEEEVEAYKIAFKETSEYIEYFAEFFGQLQAGVETGIFTFDKQRKQIEMHNKTIEYRKKVQILFPFMSKEIVEIVSNIHNEGNIIICECFDLLNEKKVMTPQSMLARLKPIVKDLETAIRTKVISDRS